MPAILLTISAGPRSRTDPTSALRSAELGLPPLPVNVDRPLAADEVLGQVDIEITT
jgi:hypothetical protein